MSDPVIIAKDVTVKFRPYADQAPTMRRSLGRWRHREQREVVALDSLSCTIERGQAVGVIGRNGAGKSTMLRVLAGTMRPDSGVIEHRAGIPTLLQLGVGFNPQLSGKDNIFLGGFASGHSRAELEKMMPGIVEFADIGDAVDRPVKTYSSGMKSRLAFSIAMTLEPETLLLDELLAVGDADFKAKSRAAMQTMLERAGTVVMVTHSLLSVKQFCDTAIWLDQGRVRMMGPAIEVVGEYADWTGATGPAKALPDAAGSEWNAGQRARIIRRLLAGETADDLSDESGLDKQLIAGWRQRFLDGGRRALRPSLDDDEDDDD